MDYVIKCYLKANLSPKLCLAFNLNKDMVDAIIDNFDSQSKNDKDLVLIDKKEEENNREEIKNKIIESLKDKTKQYMKDFIKTKNFNINTYQLKHLLIEDLSEFIVNNHSIKTIEEFLNYFNSDKSKKKKGAKKKDINEIPDATGLTIEGFKVGNKIGSGGFGNVYNVANKNDMVIKIGNLFSERNVYMKLNPLDKHDKYSHGIPDLISSGRIDRRILFNNKNSTGFYYLCLPKFETTLHKLMNYNYKIDYDYFLSSIISSLEYLFKNIKRGHFDIKPDNIAYNMGDNKFFLIDFGLCIIIDIDKENEVSKYYKGDGTLLYNATDILQGYVTRKCDLESLVFTFLKINNIDLPWDYSKSNPVYLKYKNILDRKLMFFSKKEYLNYNIKPKYKHFIQKVSEIKRCSKFDYSYFLDLIRK